MVSIKILSSKSVFNASDQNIIYIYIYIYVFTIVIIFHNVTVFTVFLTK